MTNDHTLDAREQLDLLVSRIADGEAGEGDWAAFDGLAAKHPDAWKALARAQHDHGAMSLAVGVALHAADRVELPSADAAGLFAARRGAPQRVLTWTRLGAWSGWAAAAAVAVMAWNGTLAGVARVPRGGGGNTANIVPTGWTLNTPDEAASAYVDIGRKAGSVVGELPTRPVVGRIPMVLESGERGVRVLYIRQFVEQTVVTDLARMSFDEAGRPVAVPVMPAMPVSGPQ